MAAPHSTSLRALRLLSQQHSPTPCLRRSLHITGAHSAPPTKSKATDRPSALYVSHSVTDLKHECQRRALRAGGSKSELIERLANHDVLQSRAFSIAMRRINGNGSTTSDPSAHRHFNTSRATKTVNDASPVDFVYLPSMQDLDVPSGNGLHTGPRVPVLPELHSTATLRTGQSPSHTVGSDPPPMKPQVYAVAGNGAGSEVAASPMSEVVDNHAVEIDPFSLTETVGRARIEAEAAGSSGAASAGQGQGQGQKGIVRELWSSVMDDLMGPRQGSGSSGKGRGALGS